MATLTVEGTMDTAWAVFALVGRDGYSIDYGQWTQPVTVREIPEDLAQIVGELIAEWGFKYRVDNY